VTVLFLMVSEALKGENIAMNIADKYVASRLRPDNTGNARMVAKGQGGRIEN